MSDPDVTKRPKIKPNIFENPSFNINLLLFKTFILIKQLLLVLP